MFKKVVIATDGSSHAEKAVGIGADIASKYGADVVIVHVLLNGEVSGSLMRMAETEGLVRYERPFPPPAMNFGEIGTVNAEARSEAEEARSYRVLSAVGERILATAQDAARQHGVKTVRTRLADGNPTAEILKVVEDEHADLLVCGSRGLSDLRGLLLGSVSHKLAHLSPITCMTVR